MDHHDRMRELIALAAAGVAEAGEQREAELHAAECEPCRAALQAFAAIGRELAALPATPVPPGLSRRTHSRAMAALAGDRVPAGLLCALGAFSWFMVLAGWFVLVAVQPAHSLGWFAVWALFGWSAAAAAFAAIAANRRAGRTL